MGPKSKIKIALLGNLNLDFLFDPLTDILIAKGFDPDIHVSGFNRYEQAILDNQSPLYAFHPDIIFLFLDGLVLFRDMIHHPFETTRKDKLSFVLQTTRKISNDTNKLNAMLPQCTILLNTIAMPYRTGTGLLEGNSPNALKPVFRFYNREIEKWAQNNTYIHVIDYESLVAGIGYDHWYDERLGYLAKFPLTLNGSATLCRALGTYLTAIKGQAKKVLVLDLDNTLWGGVLGEEGMAKLLLDRDGLGLAFHDFQNEILNLYKQGVLLAVSSKNNAADVMEVFDRHPHMLLKKDHFVSLKIDWRDKATHIRELAAELNLALEHFVFVDDNPAEREYIRFQLPEVTVLEMPLDPVYYCRTLLDSHLFARLSLTKEDTQRNVFYRAEALRHQLQETLGSVEEYYHSLKMQVLIKPADSFSAPRISQLTQKTNQFNLTTKRYSEADIDFFMRSKQYEILSLQLKDKFGDNGIVGLVIIQKNGISWKVDTFLLSCRVIGRTIETALLGYLCKKAIENRIKYLKGDYIPTPKNILVKDLYADHGFIENNGHWELDLEKKSITVPEWLSIL